MARDIVSSILTALSFFAVLCLSLSFLSVWPLLSGSLSPFHVAPFCCCPPMIINSGLFRPIEDPSLTAPVVMVYNTTMNNPAIPQRNVAGPEMKG